jgi:hypothetical protein
VAQALRFTPGTKNLKIELAVTPRDGNGKTEKRTLMVMPDGRYTLK